MLSQDNYFRQRQDEIWRAEDAILDENLDPPVPVDDLIRNLTQRKFKDYCIRAAIWALVEQNKIELREEKNDVFVTFT